MGNIVFIMATNCFMRSSRSNFTLKKNSALYKDQLTFVLSIYRHLVVDSSINAMWTIMGLYEV